MRYRLTCLTPVLVGDGERLSAIDYMVWKDHVSVLDQRRIFRLLAKGPRLEGYLTQLKKADKLDFASWGGFAQNFAGRRVPFEHASSSGYWERASGEVLNIPTFASGPSGPYLPGAAIKGVLRTGMLFASAKPGILKEVAALFQGDRPPRRPADGAEAQALGSPGQNRMRAIAVGDSGPVQYSSMKIYLLRVSTLLARGTGNYALGWKVSQRGSVDGSKPGDSTPIFAEMAAPGSAFEGAWEEKVARSTGRVQIFEAANQFAARLLAVQKQYAGWAGLELLGRQVADLEARLAGLNRESACLVSIGWGAGLLSKTPWVEKEQESGEYKQILRSVPLYRRAIESGLPFPKTRRIVFEQNQPASLPGWAMIELAG
ncbi:MAG TPA: type III-A CRISPR-associated RAMP protein Csm5 [Bryobacteraceae bacterium]|jgi:CRISPR-associated protein Csm5|nr:type III-A CRISPR-associated RAMP protein Csm5 [Bryobacteraceae bacterium]